LNWGAQNWTEYCRWGLPRAGRTEIQRLLGQEEGKRDPGSVS